MRTSTRRYPAGRVLLLILALSGHAAAQDGPAGHESPWTERIELKDVRHQELPAAVRFVYVGPDDRTWYVFGTTDTSRTTEKCAPPAEVKKIIEEQFKAPAPQIIDCHIAMFEKNGRVWFRPYRERRLLLGYDGRTWIEHRIGEGYLGNCPNHGKRGRGSLNLQLGERLFFVRLRGIDCFDGKEWRYERLTRGIMFDHIQLIGDGRGGLIALCVGTQSALWRYRDGTWTQIAVPGMAGKHQYPAMGALAGDDRIWVLGYATLPELVPPRKEPEAPPKELERLIVQLGAEQYRDRQAAQQRIAEMGPAVRPFLEIALKEHGDDPEVMYRLKSLLNAMRIVGPKACIMGPFAVRGAFGIWSDAKGRLIVSANSIVREGRQLGKGSILRDAKGRWAFLSAREFPRIFFNSTNLTHAGWIVVDDGKKVWFSGSSDAAAHIGPCLLDLETMRVVKRVEDPRFHHLVAVKADGTLFLGQRWRHAKQGTWRNSGKPIVVYRPDRPEEK